MPEYATHDIPLAVKTDADDKNNSIHRIVSRGERHVITQTDVETTVMWTEFADPAGMPMPFKVTIRGFVYAPKGEPRPGTQEDDDGD